MTGTFLHAVLISVSRGSLSCSQFKIFTLSVQPKVIGLLHEIELTAFLVQTLAYGFFSVFFDVISTYQGFVCSLYVTSLSI